MLTANEIIFVEPDHRDNFLQITAPVSLLFIQGLIFEV